MSGIEIGKSQTRGGEQFCVFCNSTVEREKGFLFKRTELEVERSVLCENMMHGGALEFVHEDVYPYATGRYVAYFSSEEEARECAERALGGDGS